MLPRPKKDVAGGNTGIRDFPVQVIPKRNDPVVEWKLVCFTRYMRTVCKCPFVTRFVLPYSTTYFLSPAEADTPVEVGIIAGWAILFAPFKLKVNVRNFVSISQSSHRPSPTAVSG
jgi:hypothetical protein